MALRAYIGSSELDLPDDFTIDIELHSPVHSFDIRTGDFSMNVMFPGTARNRIAFGFSDELAMAEKVIRYDDFRVEEDGELRVTGVLELKVMDEEDGRVIFDTDYFTLLLTIDIYTRKLWEVITKEVDLGDTPEDIVSAAATQNSTALSTDGETGSVLKFIPTLAEEFYGDTNPDWMPSVTDYDLENSYEHKTVVRFRLPEFINDWNMPNEIQHAIIERLFAVNVSGPDTVEPGDSPFAAPGKWDIIWPGILNNTSATTIVAMNPGYSEFFGIVNRHALIPYIQIHDIIRALCSDLGYTVEGDYMNDPLEQKALFQSNLALDKTSGRPNYVFVGNNDVIALGPGISEETYSFPLDTGIYFNGGRWITDDYYEATETEFCLVVMNIRIENKKDVARNFTMKFNEDEPPFTSALVELGSIEEMIEPETIRNIEYRAVHTLQDGYRYWVSLRNADDSDFEITLMTLQIRNLSTDYRNIYDGIVRYADHMPDITVAEFFNALVQNKNLHMGIDPASRVIRLDYQDNIISSNADMHELKHAQITASKLETFRKRRFRMNYSNLSTGFKKPQGYTELEPVASAADLPAPNTANTYILVHNENSYYQTEEYEYGGRLVWKWAGYNWPDLELDRDGELVEIKPGIGPVPMRRFVIRNGQEVLGPVLEGAGRSNMFFTDGGRPALKVIYWQGTDEGFYDTATPYATVTRNSTDGTIITTRDMLMTTVYEQHWKRTLQMLVLEERYTSLFQLRPDERAKVNFAKLLLLGNVPVIPIRISNSIGKSALTEIEFRRIVAVRLDLYLSLESSGSGGGGGGGSGSGGAHVLHHECDCPEPITTVVDGMTGLIQVVEAATYHLMIRAPYAGVISAVGVKLGAGTCTVTIAIGGTPLGGGANSATTTYSEVPHTSANVFAVNDIITLAISSPAGSPADLDFVLKMIRVL